MSRMFTTVSAVTLTWIAAAPAQETTTPPPPQEIVEVEVTGEAFYEDAALNDALRRAMEAAAGAEIEKHRAEGNFELIRDTLFAGAAGIITDYEILDKGDAAGGTKFCRVRARVSRNVIASTWMEVQNVLKQIGRPGVAVYILERIDGVIQDSSILESQIENRLLARGFKVYAGEHLRVLRERAIEDAKFEADTTRMQALSLEWGTQIFITGTAQANAAGVKELAGQPTAMYNGDGMIKMYYTDTAEMMASESLANWRGGAAGLHTHSPQGGKKALENASAELAERCYQSVMRQWSRRLSTGGELSLEIQGMAVGEALKIKNKLKDIDRERIMSVDGPSSTKGLVTFRIKAKMSAEDLAAHLVEGEWPSLIEIVDLKPMRIQAKKVGG